jgi:PAS domain S-box-containing protein
VNKNIPAHKVAISIIFGLLGFVVNFYPLDFIFYGSYRMSFLFGLLFPMLITLSWGWKYGLLSALCGGCQTMWILWLPQSGYGPLVSVPPFTIWIGWLGWFSRTRHNIYLGEIIFRIFNTALLYTSFRWVFTLNVPPNDVDIPLSVVHFIVFKELVNGLLILFIAQALLHLGRVRTFFKLPKSTEDPRLYYTYTNSLIFGGILILGFVGESYIWGMWETESQNVARILGLLLLLLIGITCTYFTAYAFAKKKTDKLIPAMGMQLDSEEKFRLLSENSIDCIWILNTSLKFTYLSPSIERIMGFKPEQWVGTKLSSHFKKKEFLKAGALAAKAIKNYKTFAPVTFETKMINSNNDEVDLEISGKPLINSKGKLIGIQGTTRDITKRKQTEEELAKYHEHLEELVRKRTAELDNRVSEVEQINIKMAKLSEGLQISNKRLEAASRQLTEANKELESFAYSVSHDLRAPLRNIDGFSQILLEEYSDILDEQGQHYLQRVRAGTQNMGQLIDDILSLSRSGRHHIDKKTINMESIVKEVCKSLENELKNRKVDFVIHECPPTFADSHLIKIVFRNLLSNALKFTRIRENAKIEIGSMTEDGHTVFFIKDNGAGFDMKYADKLFIAFQRLHRAEEYEGSGIGLAIVQRIIHRHGGRIWAESEIDVGTKFYFTL